MVLDKSPNIMEPATSSAKAVSQMNKKRFMEFEKELSNQKLDPSDVRLVLNALCKVLNFDPSVRTYTPEQVARRSAYVKESAKNLGLSLYDLTFRQYYHKNKEKCNSRVKAYRRRMNEGHASEPEIAS